MKLPVDQGARPFEPRVDLALADIEAFLQMRNWRRTERSDLGSVWHSADDRASIMLPYKRTFKDFPQRLSEALRTISEIHGIPAGESLALEIATARSDVLLLRADQATVDGSIPLGEAQALINGASKMLLAAACSAIRPRASHPGRRPDIARSFMDDEVRMGHTLRGSYVFTIFARHDSTPPVNDREQADDLLELLPDGIDEYGYEESYTRHVMVTLASGLQAASALLEPDPELSVDEAVAMGVSAELMESIGAMSQFEGLRALDMGFRWSPSQPASSGLPQRVVLAKPNMDRVESLRRTLRAVPRIRQESLIGQVVRLERAQGRLDGIVVVDGYLGNHRRRVRMNLSGADYQRAIRAHEERTKVVANGEVTFDKRSWWLRGDVTLMPMP